MQIIEANLLTIATGIIGHQVNLQGKMGAGLASQIRYRWPPAYYKYRKACDGSDEQYCLSLGKIQLVKVKYEPPLFIANLAAQVGISRTVQQTNYEALALCLSKLYYVSLRLQLVSYLPYGLGCGLGGGDWEVVAQLIANNCPNAVICRQPEKK
jgi:O-acetyl-ADP-ribose deacetylase (regulator of RNase III)